MRSHCFDYKTAPENMMYYEVLERARMAATKPSGRSHCFVVSSARLRPVAARSVTDYDYCGSWSSAARCVRERGESGNYRSVTVHRMRVAGSRRAGTRRFECVSAPVTVLRLVEEMTWGGICAS